MFDRVLRRIFLLAALICLSATPVQAADSPSANDHPQGCCRHDGAEVAALAGSLAAELTPDVIGDAARSGRHDPQQLKKVWHCLARFGRRLGPPSDAAPRGAP